MSQMYHLVSMRIIPVYHCVVLLTCPAKISHWSCHNNKGEEFLPETFECGELNLSDIWGGIAFIIQLPHSYFGGAAGQYLVTEE